MHKFILITIGMSNLAQNCENTHYERRRYASGAKIFCWKVFFKEQKLREINVM
jgi:hypothetical protein